MALAIKTTGFDDYLDGSGNIKMLVIGGPGVGKTRMSSFWPKPIYADCESGRASIADRRVPYSEIKSSKDMLDFLAYLKDLERTPKAQRDYQTVVVDTLDGFQRKVKDEWLQQTQSGTFKGFDAWGFLDSKMQMLMTRLLNLDYNVIVLVHYKDKAVKDGESESRELMLQLQGDIKDTAFNDFDLVGWLGSYWAPDADGQRVEKRGLTFHRTPDKPFLKDRFAVTPKWLPVEFTEEDYGQLYRAFAERSDLEKLPEVDLVGEIPDASDEPAPVGVVGPLSGGPVPPAPPVELPLTQRPKAELAALAKELGCAVKGNALKAELIAAIEAKQAADATSASAPEPATPAADTTSGAEPAPEAQPLTPEQVAERLGAQVISEEPAAEEAPVAEKTPPAPAPAEPAAESCADCAKDLAAENQDFVKLSFIKFRRRLCAACYADAKSKR